MGILTNFYIDTSILAFMALLALYISNSIKLKNTVKKLKSSEEYNKTLQNIQDDVRCFKHDFDNMVTTIGGYVNSNDMQGLKEYYDHLETDCKNVNNLYMLNPKIINNPGIYSLLSNKYIKAEKANIKMTFEILLDVNDIHINTYEFTRILGILLDNAIEAASKTKDKLFNICFRNEATKKRHLVIIENSYNNKDVNIDTIFEKNKTDKENHSGLGLFEVRKILNKNSNLNLYTSKDEDLFKQQLEIYYC